MNYRETKSLKKSFLKTHVRKNFEELSVLMEIYETSIDVYCKVIDGFHASIIFRINSNWDVVEIPRIRGEVIRRSHEWC